MSSPKGTGSQSTGHLGHLTDTTPDDKPFGNVSQPKLTPEAAVARLKELVFDYLEMATIFERNFGTSPQEVMGEVRNCCIICGHCPSAVAQDLKEIAEALSSQSNLRRGDGSDAI